jgi:hypothetical protein
MPARELPARPNLEQYKKQAKELVKAFRSGDSAALQRVREHHPHPARDSFELADAQLVIAREHGVDSWPKFKRQIERASDRVPPSVWREAEDAIVTGDVATLERILLDYGHMMRKQRPQSSWNNTLAPEYDAGAARAIIARTHHFQTFEEFVAFTQTIKDKSSPVARFEAAVDAIVVGDLNSLRRLLREGSDLVRARSVRVHHSTLLHCVGANGVEGFRQHTPPNAVAIGEALLEAGAEVDAVADMYRGSTTLALVATSLHPKRAGVQQALIQLLLDRGATLDHPATAGGRSLVHSCLANGRPEAARYLAGQARRSISKARQRSAGLTLCGHTSAPTDSRQSPTRSYNRRWCPRRSTTPRQSCGFCWIAVSMSTLRLGVSLVSRRPPPADALTPSARFFRAERRSRPETSMAEHRSAAPCGERSIRLKTETTSQWLTRCWVPAHALSLV